MANRMILNETAWSSQGAVNALTSEVARRDYHKASIVIDSTLARRSVTAKATDKLDTAGPVQDMLNDTTPNPIVAVVQQGLQVFQHSGVGYLIAIDGGSSRDTCKAIGIIQRNLEFVDVRSLEGLSPTRQPSVPIFAVPTITDIAAEVMTNYVITDEEQRRKFVCVDPRDIPQVAFTNVDMIGAMPPTLKAATGVGAPTHAIEGYLIRGAWALTSVLHLEAIEIIAGALRGSVAGDAGTGEVMALGQYVIGMGSFNIRLGLVHSTAHPLDAFYNISHGVANVILLPHVMCFNAETTGEKYRNVARSIGVRVKTLSLTAARQVAVEVVYQLNRDVDIPGHLREVGVRKKDILALTQAVLEDVCTGGSPREVSLADIIGLYQAAW